MKKLLLVLLLTNFVSAQTSLENKISQMIMVGFPGTELTDTMIVNDIQQRKVGGVILMGYNITSPSQVQQLTNGLQSISQTPLFISVDQEGGRVARLRESNGFEDTKTAFEIGTLISKEDTTRNWAGLMAGWLLQSGFNVNLAPVADVNVNPVSPAIGLKDRSFSEIPDSVYYHCNWFIDEFNKESIFTTLKHFPGHGSATTDSHLELPDITNTWADSELIPFQKLIENGFDDFIMSGHLYNANLDSVYPTSLSQKVLKGLLRDTLEFNGLIITDGMFMEALGGYPFGEAITLAINAGNDILLYTTNKINDKSLVDSIVSIVVDKIDHGIITLERIDESYNRIMMKKQLLTNVKYLASEIIPDAYSIINYPNPFNSSTQISVKIAQSGILSIKVYNIIGELVSEIANSFYEAGTHKLFFNANELASGVYLLRMNIGEHYSSHKVILIK